MKMLQRNHLRPNRVKQILTLPLFALLFVLVAANNPPLAEEEKEQDYAIQAENSRNVPAPATAGPGLNQDQDPTFPGGKPALQRYLKKNIKYPAQALKNGLTGQAIILVTIDQAGQPGDFKTLQADNPYFEQEAMRVLKDMPNWQPGKASLTLAFPLIFGLDSNKDLSPLKVPASKTKFVLQDAIIVVGYSQVIPGKTITQSSTAPAPRYPRDSKVFSFVDQQAEFPGGMQEMNKFISKNLKYPAEALKSGKEGLVVVQFVVDRNGKIFDPAVVKSLGPEFDEEALRVVKLFPDFNPARQNGKPVEFRLTLPIRFGLSPKDPANGYIPPSKSNPSGSYLSTTNKAPATGLECLASLSFFQNGQVIDLSKTRPTGNLTVNTVKPEGCPGGEYQIDQITYYLERESNKIGVTTQESTTLNLSRLLSLAQPGDDLVIWTLGKVVPGKNGKASSSYSAGSHIPLRNWKHN